MSSPAEPIVRSEKLEFENADGERLAGRLEVPEAPVAWALFAHCFTCSKDIAAAGRISRGLSALGIGVLRFDFTGLGNSDGDFANTNFSSNVEDLVRAADVLTDLGRAPALLVGHSLGGAAVLAARARIDGVRAVATIGSPSRPDHVVHLLRGKLDDIEAHGSAEVDLAGRVFRIRRQFLEDLEEQNLAERTRTLDAALLVFHSPVDTVVPIAEARRVFDAAKHPKSFVALDGADHLLSRARDSRFAARVLAAWSRRYVVSD